MYDKIIIISIAISLLYSEITGISPGGIITSGYIALNINNPQKLIYTFVIVILSLYIVKFISKYAIIYGKRRFAIMILTSYILHLLISKFLTPEFNFTIIGTLIPGIIANQFEKQGILKSFVSMMFVVSIVVLIMLLLKMRVF